MIDIEDRANKIKELHVIMQTALVELEEWFSEEQRMTLNDLVKASDCGSLVFRDYLRTALLTRD